ncbi:unnamed protein product [Sphenostylis stenocarpa]|uniref:Fe2OG dioxygenase domain-containing protein n=1 Tax=Sphenostylis stenocarpa TaxID=92480 RepID=A0AA86SV04_9FABA|nr:unnamed protein product [Sphenostylis stenocarpa]
MGSTTRNEKEVIFMEDFERTTELKAFDDTRQGVKGLVDAGITKIPRIFCYHPPDNFTRVSDLCHKDYIIPVVDLGNIDEDPSERKRIVERVKEAAETWGFFQIVNHGIPDCTLKEMLDGVVRFFEQDSEVKKEFYTRDKKPFMYNSNFNLYSNARTTWKDSFFCDLAPNVPKPEDLPSVCRDILLDYSNQVMKLGTLLLELLSEALGLNSTYLRDIDCNVGQYAFGHYYPSCPEPELTLGTIKHADVDFITVLLQDHIGGLQVLHQDTWIDVPPVPGALVVNIGDFLQIISNEKFKSSHHRVLANTVGPRVSIACFFSTAFHPSSRTYGPIMELLSEDNPAKYREFSIPEFTHHYKTKCMNAKSARSCIESLSIDLIWKRKMKDFCGAPGTILGLVLRTTQFLFAAGSIASMATTTSFFNLTAFCYLIASMGLQIIWSFLLALLDLLAMMRNRTLLTPVLVSLFVVGDWVTATLSLAAASASAGITVLYFHDLGHCHIGDECLKYQISVALAFLSWFSTSISSLIMFWLLAEG